MLPRPHRQRLRALLLSRILLVVHERKRGTASVSASVKPNRAVQSQRWRRRHIWRTIANEKDGAAGFWAAGAAGQRGLFQDWISGVGKPNACRGGIEGRSPFPPGTPWDPASGALSEACADCEFVVYALRVTAQRRRRQHMVVRRTIGHHVQLQFAPPARWLPWPPLPPPSLPRPGPAPGECVSRMCWPAVLRQARDLCAPPERD